MSLVADFPVISADSHITESPTTYSQYIDPEFRDRAPKNVKLAFTSHGASPGVVTPIDSKAVALAREALQIGFGKTPTAMREGGSIPVVGLVKRVLGIDTLLVAGLSDPLTEEFARRAGEKTIGIAHPRPDIP